MSTEGNKAAIRRLIDGFNQNDVAIVDEMCTSDFVLHDPAGPGGWRGDGINNPQEYKEFLSGFFASLPGQFAIDDMIAEEDKVMVRWTYHGTHQGEWRGVSPTSKEVTFTATSTYRFMHGKIAGIWQNVDNLGVLKQLGLYPA